MKKHREKQGLALLLSMAMFCALPRFGFRAEAAGGADAYWASFARDSGNAAVAESKLPISLERTEILLNGQAEKLAAKEPVIVGERMYTVVGTKLACYDLQGRRIKEAELYKRVGFFSRICYGDGKIFVLLSDCIQAFDAGTLESLWLTPAVKGQLICTLTYYDGYLYTGYTSGGGGGTQATDGGYFCVSTADENPSDGFEQKKIVWESKTGGYYWAGGVVAGGKIYFVGDSGVLYAHHLTQDIVYDTYDLGDQVRSNLLYDASTNRLIAATKYTAELFAIELNADGSFNKETVRKTPEGAIGGGVTGGVSAYNGRIYVPSGGLHSSGDFTVIDMETMRPVYTVPGLRSQSVPLICTAYASPGNGRKVYVYAVDFDSGTLFVFEDCQGQTAYKEAFRLEGSRQSVGGAEYRGTGSNSSSLKADQYGNLYMVGGSNAYFGTYGQADYEKGATAYALTIFRNKDGAFTHQDVENAVACLPEPGAAVYEDKSAVRAVEKRFAALPAAEQGKVGNAAKLRQLTDRIEEETTALLEALDEAVTAIGAPVVLGDQAAVERALQLYGRLLEEDKVKATSREKLLSAAEALYALKASVAGLTDRIAALPDKGRITLADSALVNELWSQYAALNQKDQAAIPNRQRLLDARDRIQELNDREQVADIIAEISKFPPAAAVTLADEEEINRVYARYDALHATAKELVTNRDVLEGVYAKVSGYRAAVDELDTLIWEKLDPLNITPADRELTDKARKMYEALREQERAYLQHFGDVEEAEGILDSLEKGIVPAQVFENIRDMDRSYTIAGQGYTITFGGRDITAPADFPYGLTIGGEIPEGIKKPADDALFLTFAQGGVFPGKAAVELTHLTNLLKDGEYTLYRSTDSGLLEVQKAEIQEGWAVLTLDRGGVYCLAEAPAKGLSLWWLLLLIPLAGGGVAVGVFLWKKRLPGRKRKPEAEKG